jgi:hypothetical protein
MWNQFFDGYCPESKLIGEKVRMRLNAHDFFEREKTGLQVAISYPGVHAVILKFRGKGDFRKTVKYADEVANGELLSPQLVDRFPYCGDSIFLNELELIKYLNAELTSSTMNVSNDFVEIVTNYIHSLSDFEIVTVNSSIELPLGSTYSFEKESVNMTYQNMGATIIDSILQAGVNYGRVVKPRIQKYLNDFKEIKTTSQFYKLIQETNIEVLIEWKGEKCNRILLLTFFFKKNAIESEIDLRNWLSSEKNREELKKLKGIKDKTLDYLQILSGNKQSLAIDRHLISFINRAGITISIQDYDLAHDILIKVADKLNVAASDLDHSIWKYMSRS